MVTFEDYIYAILGGIQVLHYENMAIMQVLLSGNVPVEEWDDIFYKKTVKVFERKNEHDGSDKRPNP